MLDAAQHIKLAWDAISDAAIKNSFNKAELVTLKGRAHEEIYIITDLLCSFIPITMIDELLHVDHENSEEFSNEILNDVNKVLESIQATHDNEDKRFWMTSRFWRVYKQQMIMKMKTYTLWSKLAHIAQHQ